MKKKAMYANKGAMKGGPKKYTPAYEMGKPSKTKPKKGTMKSKVMYANKGKAPMSPLKKKLMAKKKK